MELNGGVATVTGAGSGVGRELARVLCCGRRVARLEETVDLIRAEGGAALAIPTDVTDWAQVQAMVRQAVERFGQIDLLFNDAGSFRAVGPVWEADPDTWWQDVTVNLRGSMLCCRAVLPHMLARNQGVIINMDGGGGSSGPNVGGSAYGCSKAALVRFTEGLARELEKVGAAVLAFCISPGFVRTEMTEALVATPERVRWQEHVPRLMGSAEEMPPDACARATLKLLHIAAPELNGCAFRVDTDFDAVERDKAAIRAQELYVLRRRTP